MKKISTFIGLILLCGVCLSQNTGFIGKHFIINAEGYVSPSWTHPNPLTSTLNEHFESKHTQRYLGLNYFLSPNIEVIVWEKGTVGAGYNYYHSPFKGPTITKGFSTPSGNYFEETFNFPGVINAHGFNVFYKQYFRDTRAPMGWYAKFTFDGYFYNYKVSEDSIPQWMAYYNLIDTTKYSMSGNNALFGFKAEIGYDHVFFNCLRLSMGVSVGTTFGGYKIMNKKIHDELMLEDFNNSGLTTDNYVRSRMLNAYWFGIKLGIGFIAF